MLDLPPSRDRCLDINGRKGLEKVIKICNARVYFIAKFRSLSLPSLYFFFAVINHPFALLPPSPLLDPRERYHVRSFGSPFLIPFPILFAICFSHDVSSLFLPRHSPRDSLDCILIDETKRRVTASPQSVWIIKRAVTLAALSECKHIGGGRGEGNVKWFANVIRATIYVDLSCLPRFIHAA